MATPIEQARLAAENQITQNVQQTPVVTNVQQPVIQPTNTMVEQPVATLDTGLMDRVQATSGTLNANPNFVNATVKAYTGKDATQEQLDKFTGQSVDLVRGAFAPPPETTTTVDLTQEKPDLTPITPSTELTGVDAYVNKMKSVYEQLQAPTAKQTGLEDTQTTLEQNYIDMLTKQATRGARELTLEEENDIVAKAGKIKDVDAEIMGAMAQYDKLAATLESQPITTGLILGQQSQAKKMLAADISVLEAKRAMYQGQFDVAQAAVDRALDLEFGDIEQNLKNTLDFMTINESRMTREEKKQADKTTVVLNAMQEVLTDQRADKKANLDILLAVAEAGGNTSLIDFSLSPEQNLKSVGGILAEAETKDDEKYSTSQYQAATFANRVAEASTIIDELDEKFTGRIQLGKFYPEALKSEDRKKLEQAQRNFVNAVLRRESGAAIAESEFKSAEKQYFPQPGDTTDLLQQKKNNRETALRGLQAEAGGALQQTQETSDPLNLFGGGGSGNDPLGLDFSNVGGDTNQASNIKIGAGIAKRTNNPGNLVFIGQSGAVRDPKGGRFAIFKTPQEGFKALMNDIEAKKDPYGRLNSNSTLAEMIAVYAPPSENATSTYISQIANKLGVSPNTKIGQIPTFELAKFIAEKESSTIIT